MVLAAVKADGLALEFASEELRADGGVVLAAVKTDGLALQFASEALQTDRAVVLTAVAQNCKALEFARLSWESIEQDLKMLREVYWRVPVQDRSQINVRHVERDTLRMLRQSFDSSRWRPLN